MWGGSPAVEKLGSAESTVVSYKTVMFEAAELVNSRPIGKHPINPEDGTYLSPNDLLLGRSGANAPQGP